MHSDTLRRALPADSRALTELTWRSKVHWGYDQGFMEANRESLMVTATYIATHDTYLTEHSGRPSAFYALKPLDDDMVELDFLFVEPAHMGQGIGRRLFQHACATALGHGHGVMRIVSDPFACGFYQQMGAELWGEWHSAVIPGRRLPVLHRHLRCD